MRFLAAALLLATTLAPAQAARKEQDQLRFTLILARHGIRPPLTAAADLNLRSSEPWPDWEVPLGRLTPHGADAIARMGAWMRFDLARSGLLPANGCPNPADFFLYSDFDERNISSTRQTFAALAPNCPVLPVRIVARAFREGPDPLFRPVPRTFPAPPGDAPVAAMGAALPDPAVDLSPTANPALSAMARILAPNPAHPPARPILNEPIDIKPNPSGDPIVTVHGPLFAASSLVEDLALEFEDAKPMTAVGWGRLDEATLRTLLPLHVKAFGLSHRTPLFASAENSNMLAHILLTLQQGFNNMQRSEKTLFGTKALRAQPAYGAIGPTSARVVYISAHDTNLFGIAGLLGLHWSADGVDDDTPPDSQLSFELWQNPTTRNTSIRIRYRAQTLDQLRSASALTPSNPPVEVTLTPPGCKASAPCSFIAFAEAARKRVDPAYVQPELGPTEITAAR